MLSLIERTDGVPLDMGRDAQFHDILIRVPPAGLTMLDSGLDHHAERKRKDASMEIEGRVGLVTASATVDGWWSNLNASCLVGDDDVDSLKTSFVSNWMLIVCASTVQTQVQTPQRHVRPLPARCKEGQTLKRTRH